MPGAVKPPETVSGRRIVRGTSLVTYCVSVPLPASVALPVVLPAAGAGAGAGAGTGAGAGAPSEVVLLPAVVLPAAVLLPAAVALVVALLAGGGGSASRTSTITSSVASARDTWNSPLWSTWVWMLTLPAIVGGGGGTGAQVRGEQQRGQGRRRDASLKSRRQLKRQRLTRLVVFCDHGVDAADVEGAQLVGAVAARHGGCARHHSTTRHRGGQLSTGKQLLNILSPRPNRLHFAAPSLRVQFLPTYLHLLPRKAPIHYPSPPTHPTHQARCQA